MNAVANLHTTEGGREGFHSQIRKTLFFVCLSVCLFPKKLMATRCWTQVFIRKHFQMTQIRTDYRFLLTRKAISKLDILQETWMHLSSRTSTCQRPPPPIWPHSVLSVAFFSGICLLTDVFAELLHSVSVLSSKTCQYFRVLGFFLSSNCNEFENKGTGFIWCFFFFFKNTFGGTKSARQAHQGLSASERESGLDAPYRRKSKKPLKTLWRLSLSKSQVFARSRRDTRSPFFSSRVALLLPVCTATPPFSTAWLYTRVTHSPFLVRRRPIALLEWLWPVKLK